MSGTLRLRGATSGYSELQAPAVAADQTFILPTAGGTLLTTDSPIAKITLELGSASQPSLTFEGDTDTGLYSSGTNTLNLVTGGSDRLVIDSSGDVGVGSTAPNKNSWNKAITLEGSSNCAYELSDNGTLAAAFALQGDDRIELINFRSGPLTFKTNNTERLRVDSTGLIGIANSNPQTLLSLLGGYQIGWNHATDGTKYAEIYADTSSNLIFRNTNSQTERMRIDSSGRLLVGTTSALDTGMTTIIKGSSGGTGVMVARASNPSSGQSLGTIYLSDHQGGVGAYVDAARDGGTWTSGSSHPTFLRFATTADGASSPTERVRIDSSGNVGIGRNNPTAKLALQTSSDEDIFQVVGYNFLKWNGSNQLHYGGYDSSQWATLTFSTSGAEQLRITSSGNVGIGTASPNTKLEVGGSAAFRTDADVRLTLGSAGSIGSNDSNFIRAATDQVIYNAATSSGRHSFELAGSEKMRIDSSGRLLVGTSSAISTGSGHNIQAADSTGAEIVLGRSATSVGDGVTLAALHAYSNGGSTYQESATIKIQSDGAHAAGDKPGRITFSTTADGASSPTERMRIDSSGNVIIGDTSTGNAASYADNLVIGTTSGDNGMTIVSSTSNAGTINFSDGTGSSATEGIIQYDHAGDYMRFYTADTERLRIDSSGVLFLGNSSSTINYIANTNHAAKMHLGGGGSGSANIEIHGSSHATLPKYITFDTNSLERMQIRNDGHILIGTTTFGGSGGITLRNDGYIIAPAIYSLAVSSTPRDIYMDSSGYFGYITSTRESKSNIQVQDNVDWLYQLEPVTFNYKVKNRETGEYTGDVESNLEYGLIAEDVETVCSDLCFYDETDDGPKLRGIAYKKLITPMLKALQQQKEEIERLENRIAALENN